MNLIKSNFRLQTYRPSEIGIAKVLLEYIYGFIKFYSVNYCDLRGY